MARKSPVTNPEKHYILWIEDDKYLTIPARELFEDGGVAVHVIKDGSDAWRFIQKNHTSISAIIMDIMVPPGADLPLEDTKGGLETGLYLLRLISRKYEKIPLFAYTGSNGDHLAERLKRCNCRFLWKPEYPPNELVREVTQRIKATPRREGARSFIVHGHDETALREFKILLRMALS